MRMPKVLKECDEVRDFLMDYLDRKLPTQDTLVFRLHLFLCSRCRQYMNRYTSGVELAKSILNDPPPNELVNLTTEFLRRRTAK